MGEVFADGAPAARERYRRSVIALRPGFHVVKLHPGRSVANDRDLKDVLNAPAAKTLGHDHEALGSTTASQLVSDAELHLTLEELTAKLGAKVITQFSARQLARRAEMDAADHNLGPRFPGKTQ